jgi:polyferredoxin
MEAFDMKPLPKSASKIELRALYACLFVSILGLLPVVTYILLRPYPSARNMFDVFISRFGRPLDVLFVYTSTLTLILIACEWLARRQK